MRSFYQQTTGKLEVTDCCCPVCDCHHPTYWAWDRAVGGWVHYFPERPPVTPERVQRLKDFIRSIAPFPVVRVEREDA